MKPTKETALQNLLSAGYAAEITTTGLNVRGDNWSVHYSDLGQDHNKYSGNVPSEVEALAVWDDASTREITDYIILAENRGDYITRLQFQPDGDFEIHGGPAHEAIRYTLEQATSLLTEMGRGYSIEPAPAND